MLESARGPLPNVAEMVAGEPIRGSWWSHPQSHAIYDAINRLAGSPDVVRTRLVNGRVTLMHRRVWPALVRVADRFPPERLTAIREEHTSTGAHRVREQPFPIGCPTTSFERAGCSRSTKRWQSCEIVDAEPYGYPKASGSCLHTLLARRRRERHPLERVHDEHGALALEHDHHRVPVGTRHGRHVLEAEAPVVPRSLDDVVDAQAQAKPSELHGTQAYGCEDRPRAVLPGAELVDQQPALRQERRPREVIRVVLMDVPAPAPPGRAPGARRVPPPSPPARG
jgi:hypothetical protein